MAKNWERIVFKKKLTFHKKRGERQHLTSICKIQGLVPQRSEYLFGGIRHKTVAPPLSNALLYHFWSQKNQKKTKTSLQKSRDSDSMSHRIPGGGSPIARWAGCLCPCVTQRERSPCPSGGLNQDPPGCRGLAPRLRSWAARASTPAGSSRRRRRNPLEAAPRKIEFTELDIYVESYKVALFPLHYQYPCDPRSSTCGLTSGAGCWRSGRCPCSRCVSGHLRSKNKTERPQTEPPTLQEPKRPSLPKVVSKTRGTQEGRRSRTHPFSVGSWLGALILTSSGGTSICVFLSWSSPPGIWFLPAASYSVPTQTPRRNTSAPFWRPARVSEKILEHWPVVGFAGGGLVVASSFPFPASAAAPRRDCSGSSSELQHTNHNTRTFWRFLKYSCWGQTFLKCHMRDRKCQVLATFLIFHCQKCGNWQ